MLSGGPEAAEGTEGKECRTAAQDSRVPLSEEGIYVYTSAVTFNCAHTTLHFAAWDGGCRWRRGQTLAGTSLTRRSATISA